MSGEQSGALHSSDDSSSVTTYDDLLNESVHSFAILGLPKWEKTKYCVIIAMNTASESVDKIFLILLITLSIFGCEGLDWVFVDLLVTKQLVGVVARLFFGAVLDSLEDEQQDIALNVSGMVILLTSVTLMFGRNFSLESLALVNSLHTIGLLLNQLSIWKITKCRIESIYGKDFEYHQEKLLKIIGSWGNFVGTSFTLIAHFVIFAVAKTSLLYAFYAITGWTLLLDLIILGLSFTVLGKNLKGSQNMVTEETLLIKNTFKKRREISFKFIKDAKESFFVILSNKPVRRAIFFSWVYYLSLHLIFNLSSVGFEETDIGFPAIVPTEKVCKATIENFLLHSGIAMISAVLVSIFFFFFWLELLQGIFFFL